MANATDTERFSGTESLRAFIDSLDEAEWIRNLRIQALDRFGGMEWPTREDEQWRRSDISSYDFDAYEYGAAVDGTHVSASPEAAGEDAASSSLGSRGPGGSARPTDVSIVSLGDFFRTTDGPIVAAVQDLLARRIAEAEHKVELWRYITMAGGAVVHIPSFVEMDEPIVVHHTEDGDEVLASRQTIVVAEPGARATVVVGVDGPEDGEVIVNYGVDILARDGAAVKLSTYQSINIDGSVFARVNAFLSKDAAVEIVSADFGGLFVKRESRIVLEGRGADAFAGGLYFPFEDQHMDVRSVQHHRAPDTSSRAFFKGAVKDEGRSVYQGMIEVDHDAPRTDAFLENKNLVLNDGARADSIPSLQIRTNDVRCSHGSTTGKIDPGHVYYLMTRGLTEGEAKALVLEGFFEEIVSRSAPTLHDTLRGMLADRILAEQEDDED